MKVLKFWATWCAPCKVLKTTLNSFDACPMEEINVDDDPEDKGGDYGIRALPTLVLVNDAGEELWRKTGVITKAELDSIVKQHK
jgi:thioredoxin 1